MLPVAANEVFTKKRILVTDQTHVSQNASTQIQKEKEYHVVTNDVHGGDFKIDLMFSFKTKIIDWCSQSMSMCVIFQLNLMADSRLFLF